VVARGLAKVWAKAKEQAKAVAEAEVAVQAKAWADNVFVLNAGTQYLIREARSALS